MPSERPGDEIEDYHTSKREAELWDRAMAAPDDSLREGYWVLRASLRWQYDRIAGYLGVNRDA